MSAVGAASGSNGAATASSATSATANPLSTLNASDFLTLLVTQLKNQDPTSPMDPTAMITQTSTLTEVQDIQAMDTAITSMQSAASQTQAVGMINKPITYTNTDGTTGSGTVSSVSFGSSGPTLNVNGSQIALSAVQTVG